MMVRADEVDEASSLVTFDRQQSSLLSQPNCRFHLRTDTDKTLELSLRDRRRPFAGWTGLWQIQEQQPQQSFFLFGACPGKTCGEGKLLFLTSASSAISTAMA